MSVHDKFKILVVDDEKNNIDVLSHILSPKYTVLVAKEGASALKAAKERNPDLILLDVIMPGINGFETLAALKDDERTHGIPVIFITGRDSIEDEAKGLALGAVDYITKPFHHSIVDARVNTQIRMLSYVRMIERMCMIDALTNIPNRRYFDDHIKAEWKRAARKSLPLSILMADVDGFKSYNDACGHTQGDTLLRSIATILEQAADGRSGFASRLGGDEFAVLLPDTGLNEAMEVAEAIRTDVERIAAGRPEKTTVSIGVNAELPIAGGLTESFISMADKALYAAKEAGRNCVMHKDSQ